MGFSRDIRPLNRHLEKIGSMAGKMPTLLEFMEMSNVRNIWELTS